jgi:hypothetical protein
MAERLTARSWRIGGLCIMGLLNWIGPGYGAPAASKIDNGARGMTTGELSPFDNVHVAPRLSGHGGLRCLKPVAFNAQGQVSKSLTRPPGTLSAGLNCSGAPEGPCAGDY